MARRVYMDHSATTPVDGRVVEAMLPYLTSKFGNASSVHTFGQEARAGVDAARRDVASLIGARENEIVFTSGGTEANNLALRGIIETHGAGGCHIITSQIEHPAIKETCDWLEARGIEITRLPVYDNGIVRVEDVRAALRPDTLLISVMLANNEIGTIQPVAEIAQLVQAEREKSQGGRRYLYLHTDAVQAVGRMPVDVETIGCDLLALSAHKLYAPKGVGALYVRRGVRLARQSFGGRQERERRAGTESVPLVVALGAAARLARAEMNDWIPRMWSLRDRFERGVAERIENVVFNSDHERRLPHLSNISFERIEGEALLISLDLRGVAVSTGSACASGSIEPSPIILALGRTREVARGALRFSIGKDTSEEDVDHVLDILPALVADLRRLASSRRTSPAPEHDLVAR